MADGHLSKTNMLMLSCTTKDQSHLEKLQFMYSRRKISRKVKKYFANVRYCKNLFSSRLKYFL